MNYQARYFTRLFTRLKSRQNVPAKAQLSHDLF